MNRIGLQKYLGYEVEIIKKYGAKALLNPVGSFREFRDVKKYREVALDLENFDYTFEDLVKNGRIIKEFESIRDFQLHNINWFIPYFEHAYGGAATILRFADYFSTRKKVKNRFVVCGKSNSSHDEIRKKIAGLFPNLDSVQVILLADAKVDSIPQADVSIATHWTTAYPLLKFNKTAGKFYFIQDYEPLFFPAGTMYGLAEATYRFGFPGITNTPRLQKKYSLYGAPAEYFMPCVDNRLFHPSGREILRPSVSKPFNIFFYARPEVTRNAFELGITALQKMKRIYGNQIEIFTAGTAWNTKAYGLEGVVSNLNVLPYEKTGWLYRKCDLGIVFMFTEHPSYLPFELMASGCPVITNYNPATTWFLKDGENCLLTEPTISCICERMNILMNDLALRQKLIHNGLISLSKTDWNKEIEKIYDFICHSKKTGKSP